MADIGYVRSQLNGITDAAARRVLANIFEHILGNLRFGEPVNQDRAENFQAYFYSSTTASDTGEFSVAHGLAVTPNVLLPILDVKQVGATWPSLTISRAADSRRVYFKAASGSTSMAFKFLLE